MGKTIEGTTRSGFRFSVAANAAEDMELLDDMAALQDGSDPFALSRVCQKILGKEQRKRLYDHIRGADGRVPPETLSNELVDVFGGFGAAGKNSEPSPE